MAKSTVETRANTYARKHYGSRATAIRVTGTRGLSGYFQAYLPMPRGQRGLNSVGNQFHIS